MSKYHRYSPKIRELAAQLVVEHQDEYRSEWAVLNLFLSRFRRGV